MFLTVVQMGAFILLGLWVCAMLAIVLLAIWLLKWVVWNARGIPNAPSAQAPMQQAPVYTPPQQYDQNGYQPQYQPKE